MAVGIGAIGGFLAAHKVGSALMALMMGSKALDFYTQQKQLGIQEAGVGLEESRLQAAAGMGKKEEERTQKLIEQLMKMRTSERRETQHAATESEDKQMAMAMMMALAQLGQQQSGAAVPSGGSSASMLSLMR